MDSNNQDKDLRNFFQDKLTDREFELDKGLWADLENMLPVEEEIEVKTAKRISNKYIWGSLVLLLLTSVSWLYYSMGDSENIELTTKNDIVKTLNIDGDKSINDDGEISVNQTINDKESQTKEELSSEILEGNFKNNFETLPNIKNAKTESNSIINTSTNQQNGINQVKDKLLAPQVPLKFGKKEEKTSKTNNSDIPNDIIPNHDANFDESKPVKNNQRIANNSIVSKVKNPIDKHKVDKSKITFTENNGANKENESSLKDNTIDSKSTINIDNSKDEKTAIVITENDNVSLNINRSTDKNESLMIDEVNQEKFVFLSKKIISALEVNLEDSLSVVKTNCDGCPHKPSYQQLDFGLIGGLSIAQGWINTGSSRAGLSLDPTIGFRLDYMPNSNINWGISSAILYSTRSSLNGVYSYENTDYVYGAISETSTINFEEIHNLTLPISAVYRTPKHNFMGGLSFNYLVNSRVVVNRNQTAQTLFTPEQTVIPTIRKWDYQDAFNRYTIGLTFGYEYEVNNKWRVGTQFNYGLMDVAKNEIFKSNTFDNDVNVRILLTYNLNGLVF